MRTSQRSKSEIPDEWTPERADRGEKRDQGR
jgi:hypothetical protein